ncbi:MAG: thiamine-phosphate kinase [Planctomycetota bacterium]
MDENELLARIAAREHRVAAPCPIGDDCCWWEPTGTTCLSVDSIVAGRHFTAADPPAAVGRKAAGAALSDLAAMGATPVGAVLALHVAPGWDALALAEACREELERHGCPLLGGDTTAAGELALSVSVWGEVTAGARLLRRDGGCPGDLLVVSGRLGGAQASGRHLTPEPRLVLGSWLARQPGVHALMDLSDGLAADAPRLAAASGCGCLIDAARIPIHPDVPSGPLAARLRAACCDGEDFELLAAVDPQAWPALQRDRREADPQLQQVGELCHASGNRLRWSDGTLEPLSWRGFAHQL